MDMFTTWRNDMSKLRIQKNGQKFLARYNANLFSAESRDKLYFLSRDTCSTITTTAKIERILGTCKDWVSFVAIEAFLADGSYDALCCTPDEDFGSFRPFHSSEKKTRVRSNRLLRSLLIFASRESTRQTTSARTRLFPVSKEWMLGDVDEQNFFQRRRKPFPLFTYSHRSREIVKD